jgi:tetratricopeptide (TPR) repeat protein
MEDKIMGRKTAPIMQISLLIFIFCAIQVLYISNANGDQDANLSQGKSAIEKGDYKEGVALLAKAVEEGATDAGKNEYRTKTLEILNAAITDMFGTNEQDADYKGILKLVNVALGYDCYKNSELLYHQKATVYRKKEDFKKAIEEYNNALNIDEKHYPSRYYLALSYYKQKEYQKAYDELGKIPASDPSLGKTAKEKRDFLMKNFGNSINN